jgi:hypothetical protein
MVVDGEVVMRRCVGCGALVPNVEGSVHPYMESSPGCWQWYGELTAAGNYLAGAADLVRLHSIDCFAAQHPGGAVSERRQRQSVAVHLTALCLIREFGIPASRLPRLRQHMSATVLPRLDLDDWPYLAPPASLGSITIADLHRAVAGDGLARAVDAWSAEVWQAWRTHHGTVGRFAQAALGVTT